MTSTITKETYAKLETFDFGSGDETKEFVIRNFYIDRMAGTVFIRKFSEYASYKFKFKWNTRMMNRYTSVCTNDCHNNYFFFSTFEEFETKIKKQYICKYHSFCPDNCPVNQITSPEEKCAICLNDVQLHLLEQTACGHHFCLSCLDKYVQSKIDKEEDVTCPTCRRNIEYCSECERSRYECDCKKCECGE